MIEALHCLFRLGTSSALHYVLYYRWLLHTLILKHAQMLVLILLAQVGKKMQAIEVGGPESGGLQDDDEEEDLADGSDEAAPAGRQRGGKDPVASSSQQGGQAAASEGGSEGGPMKRPKHGGTAAVVATAADDEMTAGRWGEPGSLLSMKLQSEHRI